MTSRSEEAVPGIVETLRASARMVRDDIFQSEPDLLDEAADHIERLTSALEGVASDCQLAIDALGNSGPEFDSVKRGLAIIRDRARDTLSLIKKQGNGHGEG